MRLPRLAVALLAAAPLACDDKKPAPSPAPPPAHEHRASRGGMLVELGEEQAHVELVVDVATGAITAYVLDHEAEKSIRIAQPEITLVVVVPGQRPAPVPLRARDNPVTGDAVGRSSEFAGQFDGIRGLKEWEGSIQAITVLGATFENVAFHFPSGNENEKK